MDRLKDIAFHRKNEIENEMKE